MNSELALQIMRFGFLALLWLFVLATMRVIRGDLRTSGQPRVAVPPPARRRGGGRTPAAPSGPVQPSHLLVTAASDADAMQSSCAPNCDSSERNALSDRLVISNVALGVGAVALTASAITWLVSRK
jgi:hypothetical protein